MEDNIVTEKKNTVEVSMTNNVVEVMQDSDMMALMKSAYTYAMRIRSHADAGKKHVFRHAADTFGYDIVDSEEIYVHWMRRGRVLQRRYTAREYVVCIHNKRYGLWYDDEDANGTVVDVRVMDGVLCISEHAIDTIEAPWIYELLCMYYMTAASPIDGVMESLTAVPNVLINPASASVASTPDSDVSRVTEALVGLMDDPKNSDRLKAVELAFLTCTTILSDKFWKKMLGAIFVLLDLTVEKSLLESIWSVLSMQLFEGNKISAISEMMKSLKFSSATKSMKQFLATFLVPIVGEKKLSVGEIELLSIEAAHTVTGVDLVACVFETLDYLTQAGTYLRERGSLIGFLVPFAGIRPFMEKYWVSMDTYEKVKIAQADGDLGAIYEEFRTMQIELSELRRNITDPVAIRQLNMCHSMLSAKSRECMALLSEGDFKRMPFSMYLYGPTRCGKTTITNILLQHISDALGEDIKPGTKATITGSSKFMTELRPTTKWVVIDDVASIKPDYIIDPPAEVFLRLVNNVITSLNQASIERKGEPAPRPHAVICTSNVYDMGAAVTQNDPRPILARIHMHVEVNVKMEWRDEQGLFDAKRFFEQYNSGDLPDAWDFTIRYMVPEDDPIYTKTELREPPTQVGGVNYHMAVIEDDVLGRLENVGIDTFIKMVRRECVAHTKVQAAAETLRAQQDFVTHFCETCKNRHNSCVCGLVRDKASVDNAPIEPDEGCVDHIDECVTINRDVTVGKTLDPPQTTMIQSQGVKSTLDPDGINPADSDGINAVGMVCTTVHETMQRYHLKSRIRKLDSTKERIARATGIDIDRDVLTDKCTLLLDAIFDAVTKARVFHYATWLVEEPSDTMLSCMVKFTQEREINRIAYSRAIPKFLRRMGYVGLSACNPVVGTCCAWTETCQVGTVAWLEKKFSEWMAIREVNITSYDSEENRLQRLLERHMLTDDDITNIKMAAYCGAGCASLAYVAMPVAGASLWSFAHFLISTSGLCGPATGVATFATFTYAVCMLSRDLSYETNAATMRIMCEIRTVRDHLKKIRCTNRFLSSFASVGFCGAGLWAKWSDTMEINPASMSVRDPLYFERWLKAHTFNPTIHQTADEVKGSIKNNVVYIEYERDGVLKWTCGTGIQTSRIIVNNHFLPTERTKMRLIRSPTTFSTNGDVHKVINSVIHIDYEPGNEVQLGPSDLVVVRTKERIQFSDIVERFSTSLVPHSTIGTFITRNKDGELSCREIGGMSLARISTKAVHRVTGASFPEADMVVFKGVNRYGECGSPVITGHKKAVVCGIFSGKPDAPDNVGYALCVTQCMLKASMLELDRKCMPDVSLPSISGFLLPDQTITKKSNLAHLPDGDLHFDYLGKVDTFTPERDQIEYTSITKHLQARGYENHWVTPVPGANPTIKSYDASMKYIKAILDTHASPTVSALARAREDYFSPLQECIRASGKRMRPLEWLEVTNGVPGSAYIHPLDTSTSMGFGYTGKKRDHMHQVDQQWWFDDDIMCDLKKADKQLRNRKMPVMLASVFNKMAPTKQGKPARKVTSVNIIATCLLKKYFGMAFDHIIGMGMSVSECAVGINPYSLEWNDLWKDIKPSPFERVFDGDFSGFDVSIKSYILEQACVGLCNINKEAGFSEEDMNACYTLVNWILSAMTVVDGEVLIMYDRVISGMVGTSIIDGIVISIIFRCVFFDKYPNGVFRDAVTLRTYGDDNISKVKPMYGRFNKYTVMKYCTELGMKFTTTDKRDVTEKWTNVKDVTFLKRHFRYSNHHKAVVGPLEVDSILKPLHVNVRSKALSQDELLIENMSRALVEMSFHGEKEWARLRDALVSGSGELFDKTTVCDWTYSDFISAWKLRYGQNDHSDFLGNLRGVFCIQGAANPASAERRVEEYVDDVATTHETLQVGASVEREVRRDLQPNVLHARSTENVDLGDFLSRPIEIFSASLSAGSTIYTYVNFWKVYLKNPVIRNKLAHYRFIRGTATLEAYFNVTPKFYGKYILAINWKSPAVGTQDGSFGDYGPADVDNVLASQTLATYVSADIDKAELTVPFMMRSEYIDMAQDTITYGEPGAGWIDGEAGLLYLRSMVPLRYAGDPPTGSVCDIIVTMRLTDVELRGTTSAPIANPASGDAVHSVKEVADKVVRFGTVAMNIAENIGAIAAILGFSRDNVGGEPTVMRVRGVGNTALVDVPTLSAKTSVHKDQAMYVGYDPLREVSVSDPELLCNIACHDSYITKFLWQESDPSGTHLFSIRVKPNIAVDGYIAGTKNMTSMCFASYPFSYWTGSITFHFDIVSSFLHRGRLLFVYDTFKTGAYDLTQNKCAILDISTNHEVALTVTPNACNTFVKTSGLLQAFSSVGFTTGDHSSYGVISVYVLNRLSAPESTLGAPVDVLVYGHMERDAQFAQPGYGIMETSFINPASASSTHLPAAPASGCVSTHQTSLLMNNEYTPADDMLGMYFGERITSIRSMLQRFAYHCSAVPMAAASFYGYQYITMHKKGVYRGLTGNNNPSIEVYNHESNTVSGVPSNFVVTTPLQYWSSAFVGMRGSTRWKFVSTLKMSTKYASLSYAGWDASPNTNGYFNCQPTTTISSADGSNFGMAYSMMTGTQIEQYTHNQANEVEVPFYCNHKFIHCRTTRENLDCSRPEYTIRDFVCNTPTDGENVGGTHIFTAVGDDFTLLGYVGPPRIWVGLDPPDSR